MKQILILNIFCLFCFGLSWASAQNVTVYPQVDTLTLLGTCTPPGFICTMYRTNNGSDQIIVRPCVGELLSGAPFGRITARFDSAYFQILDSLHLNQYEIFYTNNSAFHPARFKVPIDSLVYSNDGECKITLIILQDNAIIDSAILSFDTYQTGLGVNEDQNKIPNKPILLQNYPNPFNPSTKISFSIPSWSHVSIRIFDLLGRETVLLASEILPAGDHSRQWNASGNPSGVYFCQLQAGSFCETKKLILIK